MHQSGNSHPYTKCPCTPHRRTPVLTETSILFLFKQEALRASQPSAQGRGPDGLCGPQVTWRGRPGLPAVPAPAEALCPPKLSQLHRCFLHSHMVTPRKTRTHQAALPEATSPQDGRA